MALTYDPLTGLPRVAGQQQQRRFGTLVLGTGTNQPDSGSAAPPGARPPGQINFGGFTPDYAKLIANDPGLLGAQAALGAANSADLANRDALIKRAYATAGMPIDLSGVAAALGLSTADVSGILDPTTQALAQQNTASGLSTEARLNQAHQFAVRQIKNALNARGLLGSGEAGYQLGKEQTNFAQGQYDARQKLLDYLSSYQQGYLSAANQRAQALAGAYSSASATQQGLPQNQPTPPTTAVFSGYTPDGQPLYKAPDGTLHLLDGSVWTPDTTATPPTTTPTTTPDTTPKLPDGTRGSGAPFGGGSTPAVDEYGLARALAASTRKSVVF